MVFNHLLKRIIIIPLVLMLEQGNVIRVTNDIDLGGKELVLPENSTLVFKGGIIRNGSVVGSGTDIVKGKDRVLFDNVEIKGSWNVREIFSSWFNDIDSINSLKNVLALTSPITHNVVYLEDDIYLVRVGRNAESVLKISSNTDVIIDGTIMLQPNGFSHYSIIEIKGNNIRIWGKGEIVGDCHEHMGKEGEWGMGVKISNSSNVHINGISIRDCWGDCIYINENSKDLNIENCSLSGSRRQGISITDGSDIHIKDLKITNIKGTSPEYAIDIEPNKNCSVDNVRIEGLSTINCRGGLLVYGGAAGAHVGKVSIRNSRILNSRKLPVRILQCSDISIIGCHIEVFPEKAITCIDTDSVKVRRNLFSMLERSNRNLIQRLKLILTQSDYIEISNSEIKIVSDNTIIN